ncbi:MAG: lysophospholipid acyltransferase family protein [Parcubacteria group bacterium]
MEIRGKENIRDLKGPILLVPNHTQELDPTVIPLITSFFSHQLPVYSVIYPVHKYNDPSFSWRRYVYKEFFFNILGGYPVNSGSKDYEISLQNHIKILENNKTLCIFPEGKCTLDGNIANAHGGMGYLAYRTNATIVPVAINTFFDISFFNFLLRRRKLIVTILPPILPIEIVKIEDPKPEDFKKAGEFVLQRIREVM